MSQGGQSSVTSDALQQQLTAARVATNAALDKKLTDHRSGLLPGRIIEIERERQSEIFRQNIMGNAMGLAVLEGMDDDTARLELENIVASAVKSRLDERSFKLEPQLAKRRERYRIH